MAWLRAAHAGHQDLAQEVAGVVGGRHVTMPDTARLVRHQEQGMSELVGSVQGFYGATSVNELEDRAGAVRNIEVTPVRPIVQYNYFELSDVAADSHDAA